ncbi:MAG: alpha/beta hydrolase family protein [Acholeplasmataceae bacterium]
MAFIECQVRSNELDMNISVNVIYPEHVKNHEEVKVLYLFHGYTGHYMDWMRQTAIERYANKYQICVVMPSVHNSYYTNNTCGVNYFNFVAIELPEIIENMFHVSQKSEDRYACGLSMGGYGALKVGFTYPHKFHKIASLSGAIDVDRLIKINENNDKLALFKLAFGKSPIKGTKNDIYHLVDQAVKTDRYPDIYLACGKDDFLYEDHLRFKAYLDEKNVPYVHKETSGGHEWRLWDLFVQDVLEWMFE